MKLADKFRERLATLSPFADASCVCDASVGERRVECEMAALDSLACEVKRLSYSTPSLANRTSDEIRGVAESLSKQLNYLMEPISPIEIDADQCVVQMRSMPPRKDERGREYYELTVKAGGSVRLERFSKRSGAQRTAIALPLTREVLLRLVADLERVVG